MAMFKFTKRSMLPRLSDLCDEQVELLFGATVTHIEVRRERVFSRWVLRTYVWLLGARQPLRWNDELGWVDGKPS